MGTKYFEWPVDERYRVIKADALDYVNQLIAEHTKAQPQAETQVEQPVGENKEKPAETESAEGAEEAKTSDVKQTNQNDSIGLYDIIIIDINDSSLGSKLSPPKEFLEQEFLANLKRLLTDSGLLMINLVPFVSSVVDACLKDIHKTFDVIFLAKPETEINHVAYMLNTDLKRQKGQDNNELVIVEQNKVPSKKELEISFKAIAKRLAAKWDPTMNLDQYCGEIVLKFPQMNGNPFLMTNVQVAKEGGELSNKTKDMYLEDKEKVTKSQRKKKKNKNR